MRGPLFSLDTVLVLPEFVFTETNQEDIK